ncbi:Knr4/Smi1-like domain-containing protein [Tumidithrix helvetica PCC 7403]|uniref:SMI1/KNR4 family protein n=1 Tax=Tumidithrix helvetica TaxID=3457545 RepID=UPI003C865D8B
MGLGYLPEQMERVLGENTLLPCSDRSITELEQKLEISLPKLYKEFLQMMGNGAGKFLQGEDCFYPQLPLIQGWAKELLQENNFPESLPDDAFVFFMHQGYQFSFFKLSEGDNPPIYSYCEGQEETHFIKNHDKFSDFLSVEIELYNKYSMPLAA